MQQTTTFQDWLQIQVNLGRSPNTVAAYRRGLADFLAFGETIKLDIHNATREHISLYVRSLLTRPVERYAAGAVPALLANATVQQCSSESRLFAYITTTWLKKGCAIRIQLVGAADYHTAQDPQSAGW